MRSNKLPLSSPFLSFLFSLSDACRRICLSHRIEETEQRLTLFPLSRSYVVCLYPQPHAVVWLRVHQLFYPCRTTINIQWELSAAFSLSLLFRACWSRKRVSPAFVREKWAIGESSACRASLELKRKKETFVFESTLKRLTTGRRKDEEKIWRTKSSEQTLWSMFDPQMTGEDERGRGISSAKDQ